MEISKSALRAKGSCASGFRWFARRFNSATEYQQVLDALVDDGRVDDACWLMDQFGPTHAVRVLDTVSAPALVFAGSLHVRQHVEAESLVRVGGSLRAGGGIRAGNGAGQAIVVGGDLHAV